MKRIIVIVIVLAIAATFINDVGRYARTRYNLDGATNDIVDASASTARDKSRNEAAQEAAVNAQAEGIRVTAFSKDELKVQVWTAADVSGTWVLGRFSAWRKGLDPETPYVLADYGESVYR